MMSTMEKMTITLPEDLGNRVRDEARRAGLDPSELVRRVVAEHLQVPDAGRSLDELFSRWEAEDLTSDPKELAQRSRETEELKRAMNRNRLETEGPESRTSFK